MKGFLFFLLLCLASNAQAQTFEMRLTNNGGGVIGVQMRETSGVGTPTQANFLTDLVFAICWDASYGINLTTITSNYTMQKAGPETVNGATEFQLFAKDPNPITFPTDWVQNDWVTIMTIPNNLAGAGLGNFAICPVNIQELNINIDFNDFAPANVGGANGVFIGVQALGATTTQVNVSCNGGSNGSIDVTVTGGTAPYTYDWGVGQPTTEDRTGLAAGTYTVTVTDAVNATTTVSATITQPTALALNTTQINVSCNGGSNGSIDLTVAGGTAPYTYDWGVGQPTTEDRSGLAAGTYSVTVTDGNNCVATTSATIIQPAILALSTTQVNVSCNGGTNGSIDLTVTGGTGPYTYNWGMGQPTTEDRSSLAAGTYNVTVTDANSCTAITSATITQPAILALSTTQVNVSCNAGSNGSIDLSVTGGTGPYTYNWGMGQPTTEDRSGLTADTYNVTVTDANSCTAITSATIDQPTALALSTTQVNASCNGGSNGSIDLSVTGGTAPYTYNWGMGQPTTEDRSGLAGGTYNVTVTDANNCTAATSATITQPAALALGTTTTNATCGNANGSIDLEVSGGTMPYTYNWGMGQPTTQDRTGLAAGTYTVTVTDANNCTAITSATIINANSPVLSATKVDLLCNGAGNGSIDLTVTGGASPYTYNWGMGQPTTEDRSGLSAGTYTVIVTDDNGCAVTTSETITEPTALALSTDITNADCNGPTGAIDLTVTGGTPGYTYDWTDLAGPNDPQNRNNLAPATYTVEVADANGCTMSTSATVVIDFSNQTPLTITCPPAGSIPTLIANSSCQALIGDYTGMITITGGCGGALNPTVQIPAPGTIVNPGTVAITLTISNNVGESSSCTVNVTISGGCGN